MERRQAAHKEKKMQVCAGGWLQRWQQTYTHTDTSRAAPPQVKALYSKGLLQQGAQLRDCRIQTRSLNAPLPPLPPPWSRLCSSYPTKAEIEFGFVWPCALLLGGGLLLLRVSAVLLLQVSQSNGRCARRVVLHCAPF